MLLFLAPSLPRTRACPPGSVTSVCLSFPIPQCKTLLGSQLRLSCINSCIRHVLLRVPAAGGCVGPQRYGAEPGVKANALGQEEEPRALSLAWPLTSLTSKSLPSLILSLFTYQDEALSLREFGTGEF